MITSLSLIIPPAKPVTFRVYCYARKRRRSSPYYKVMIFRDVALMRRFALEQSRVMYAGRIVDGVRVRTNSGDRSRRASYWKHAYGCARWWGEGKENDPDRKKMIGVILLARGYLTDVIIAHEIAHAAIYFVIGSGRPAKFKDAHDERLATVIGELTRQFFRAYDSILAAHVRRRRGKRKRRR